MEIDCRDPAPIPACEGGDSGDDLDWSSLAVFLAESSGRPMAFLEHTGKIRLLSGAMAHILGWRSHEVEGRYWWDVCGPPGSAPRGLAWLDQVLRGVLRSHQCEVIARSGSRFLLRIGISVMGREHARIVVLSVENVTPLETEGGSLAAGDGDYVITRVATGFGRLHHVATIGRRLLETGGGPKLCYVDLAQRDSPCPDCPFLQADDAPWPRVSVRRRGNDDGFEVVSGEPVDETTGRIRVRNISDAVLGAIHEAKVRVLADKAHLSDRERSVLEYLRMGRSLDEIAGILCLSRRTVKFHQANILQKLGADSRFHLISLAGF